MPRSSFSKVLTVLIAFLTLSFIAYPVFAENGSTGSAATIPNRPNAANEAIIRRKVIQDKVETKKANIADKIADFREKLASKEAALKAKLAAFKDQRKAQVAERVNTNLNKINQTRTANMQRQLDTMSAILTKLEARVNKSTPDIKDPAAAKAAINSARATIATASAAVQLQTQKDYTIQVTTEAKVRTDAKLQRDKLFADLSALRKTIIDSKQAVSQAIRVAKTGSVPAATGLRKEGTASGRQ